MSAAMSAERPSFIGITVKLTPVEHEALRAVVFSEGHSSFQNFFRSLAVRKIREAKAVSQEGDGDGYA